MSDRFANEHKFDVAILGTGVGGAVLGAILARHGVKVLLLEQGVHPRFAIGESTIPETTILLRLLAKRYSVPEIAYLSNFQQVRAHISSACGVKRNFSFCYHRSGEPNRAKETTQFPTWAPPYGPDVHYFRQDVDAHMLATAIAYGAAVRQQTQVRDIAIDSTGVKLCTDKGEEYQARYVVDAGGIQAPLARKFNLRESPCSLKTHSRSIFTHMTGVMPYDMCGPPRSEHRLPSPFSQGTLHHLFKGGWMWVIPFDNHPTSTNPLCSVGINFDLSQYPRTDVPPEQEFWNFIKQFPSIEKQFSRARAVRNWVATDRLQFNSTRLVGNRFCLLPHAAAFVDPLFSSGLAITMSTINVLADRLIEATRSDDFSTEHFEYIDTWVKNSFAYYDQLVSCSYTAFSSFELWNAWHRIWMLGGLYGVSALFEVLSQHSRTGDPSCFRRSEQYPYRGVQALDLDEYAQLLRLAALDIEAVREGTRSVDEAVSNIYELLDRSGLCPGPWNLLSAERRCPGTFTLLHMLRLVAWGRYRSPKAIRKHYFHRGRTTGFISDIGACIYNEVSRAGVASGGLLRDVLFSWNRDWAQSQVNSNSPPPGDPRDNISQGAA